MGNLVAADSRFRSVCRRALAPQPSILQSRAIERRYMLAQLQLFPQLHSLLSFMGQFLPVFLQFGLSAANETVQTTATRIENNIFV
jgi:hypothetical protein